MTKPDNWRYKTLSVCSVIFCGSVLACFAACKKSEAAAGRSLGQKSSEVVVMPEALSRSFYWKLVLHNDLQAGFKNVFSTETRAELKNVRATKGILGEYKVRAVSFMKGDPSEADHIRACELEFLLAQYESLNNLSGQERLEALSMAMDRLGAFEKKGYASSGRTFTALLAGRVLLLENYRPFVGKMTPELIGFINEGTQAKIPVAIILKSAGEFLSARGRAVFR